LRRAGYVEGQNVAIEYHWADGHYDRLPLLAADLVHRHVAVIVTFGGVPAALAAKAATTTIPIVFFTGADPIASGLVSSLSRPDGNLTGTTTLGDEVGQKRLELLHELSPAVTIIALVVNPTTPVADIQSGEIQAAAHALGLQLHILHASTELEINRVFASLVQLRADALAIAPDAFFITRKEQFAALTLRHGVPAIYPYREFVVAGGLMSYGSSIRDTFGVVAVYTAQILKGEKPANLPVQRATKIELIINLTTAKVLGLDLPASVLARADELIE
jgi:putative tryptophan/tyrosine transport system substrate-binding protein